MALEALHQPPTLEDFTSLHEHQQQTPGSFFGGKPVLHLHAPNSTILVPADQFPLQPDLTKLTGPNAASPVDGNVHIEDVDIWVTCSHLLFYSPTHSSGLQISYPAITVTAQDGPQVLLELNLSDSDTPDEDIRSLQLRIQPTDANTHTASAEDQASAGAGTNGTTSHNDVSTALFKAISDCQELNPDPPGMGDSDEEGAGAFDETAPGVTGWITNDNMHEFMDENGNFRLPSGEVLRAESEPEEDDEEEEEETGQAQQSLGAGAGRTRTATEANQAEDGAAGEESKWQRTG